MKIKNKLFITATVSLSFAIFILSSIFYLASKTTMAVTEQKLAHSIHQAVSELDIITYEFLMHHEKRMESQWRVKYSATVPMLEYSAGKELTGIHKELLEEIRSDYKSLGKLFSKAVESYSKKQKLIQEGFSGQRIEAAVLLEERVVTRLLISSQSIITNTSRFATESLNAAAKLQLKYTQLTVVFIIIFIGYLIIVFIYLGRNITIPLAKLTNGAGIIGKGNLEYQLNIKTKDEIGDLASAFGQMTSDLKKITSSRDELNNEINERRRVEGELRESKEQFALFMDFFPGAVFIKDTESRYLFGNKYFVELFGINNLIGKTPFDFFPEEAAAKMIEDDRKTLAEDYHQFSQKLCNRNGAEIILETHKFIIRRSTGVPFVAGIGLDVTERFQAAAEKENLESQLRQSHKMEAIGTLAGGIAHDFNNILAAILGYAEMAQDDIPEWSPARHQIGEVLKAGNRAKDLVKHILSFSRKEAKERSPVPIHLVTKEALKLLRASIPTTIEIKQNIDSKCGNILGDPTQIHQVLMNLGTNSAQAMDENGGILEVGLTATELRADDLANEPDLKPGHYVLLSVKDSGIGIEQNYFDRIFDPYFTTKEVGKGSGMGLAVVVGIVKSHDGMITVDSKPGKGTTFRVYFPRIEGQINKEVEVVDPLPTGKEKILVVDDEQSIVDMTRHRLERLGYQVTTFTSSMEALELFRSHPDGFDLVITDQTMPQLTGEKLAKKLMEIRTEIPIIICTGHSSKIDAEKADYIGVSAFIMKPVDKRELAKTIRYVLDRGSKS